MPLISSEPLTSGQGTCDPRHRRWSAPTHNGEAGMIFFEYGKSAEPVLRTHDPLSIQGPDPVRIDPLHGVSVLPELWDTLQIRPILP